MNLNLKSTFLFILFAVFILFYFLLFFKRLFFNNKKKLRFILFNKRLNKIKNFENLSEMVMKDVLDAIKTGRHSYEHAKALLPLLSDVRKIGEKLLSHQYFYHTLLFPNGENKLKPRINRLIQVEKLLKSLPTESLSWDTIHQEGRFKVKGS